MVVTKCMVTSHMRPIFFQRSHYLFPKSEILITIIIIIIIIINNKNISFFTKENKLITKVGQYAKIILKSGLYGKSKLWANNLP